MFEQSFQSLSLEIGDSLLINHPFEILVAAFEDYLHLKPFNLSNTTASFGEFHQSSGRFDLRKISSKRTRLNTYFPPLPDDSELKTRYEERLLWEHWQKKKRELPDDHAIQQINHPNYLYSQLLSLAGLPLVEMVDDWLKGDDLSLVAKEALKQIAKNENIRLKELFDLIKFRAEIDQEINNHVEAAWGKVRKAIVENEIDTRRERYQIMWEKIVEGLHKDKLSTDSSKVSKRRLRRAALFRDIRNKNPDLTLQGIADRATDEEFERIYRNFQEENPTWGDDRLKFEAGKRFGEYWGKTNFTRYDVSYDKKDYK